MAILVEQSSVEIDKEDVSGRISHHQDQRLPANQESSFPRPATKFEAGDSYSGLI